MRRRQLDDSVVAREARLDAERATRPSVHARPGGTHMCVPRSRRALQRARSVLAEGREIGWALLGEGAHALLRLGRARELVQAAERERALPGEVLGLLIEGLLEEAQRGRRQGEDL